MKKFIKVLFLVLLILTAFILIVACNNATDMPEKGDKGDMGEKGDKGDAGDSFIVGNEQMLAFYPLDDGTLAVGVGNARFLSEITVPETYVGKTVTAVAPEGFLGAENIKSVTLPQTIESVGEAAFSGCKSLEKIVYGVE